MDAGPTNISMSTNGGFYKEDVDKTLVHGLAQLVNSRKTDTGVRFERVSICQVSCHRLSSLITIHSDMQAQPCGLIIYESALHRGASKQSPLLGNWKQEEVLEKLVGIITSDDTKQSKAASIKQVFGRGHENSLVIVENSLVHSTLLSKQGDEALKLRLLILQLRIISMCRWAVSPDS